MTDTELLIKALELWRSKLVKGAYPDTAVQRLIGRLRLSAPLQKYSRAERQLAITALTRFGPRPCSLLQRLERAESHDMAIEAARPSRAGQSQNQRHRGGYSL